MIARTVASFRLLRGRCPSCNSEGAGTRSCRTCLGYEGPFPPSEATRTRWAGRFTQTAHGMAPAQAQPAVGRLSPVR